MNKYGGERLDLEDPKGKGVLVEHLARYRLVEGPPESIVLDAGCAEGHGSRLLAERFAQVYGVDLCAEAVAAARKLSAEVANLSLDTGSATDLAYKDGFFDRIAAFEMFEHVSSWQELLAEFRRVLKPGGVLYISTPNVDVYSAGRRPSLNKYHLHEMDPPEFREALSTYFTVEGFLGQRTPVYNDHVIWGELGPMLHNPEVPHDLRNAIKLTTCDWIKPSLDNDDIVFSDDPAEIARSRFLIGICRRS